MNDISIGAVGAAVIAGLVSLLGLIIGKEQKVSEFRQSWIDDLRGCLVSYLVHINAIADALRLKAAGKEFDNEALLANYKNLNEASHGITLRVNDSEDPPKDLLAAMEAFEGLASKNADLTPDNIRKLEKRFVTASKSLLKFEWKRVKTGEKTYVVARRITLAATALMVVLLLVLRITRVPTAASGLSSGAPSQSRQTVSVALSCTNDAERALRGEHSGT